MPKRAPQDSMLLFFVGASLFGLFTVPMLALNAPATVESFPWREPLVGSVFALICLLGIVAAFFPEKCSGTLHLQTAEGLSKRHIALSNTCGTIKGHHPDCGEFDAHTIRVKTRVLCAACAGLVLGALVAVVGTLLYFFAGMPTGELGLWPVLLGQAGVAVGFVQFRFRGAVRLVLNFVFVVGAYLVMVGMDMLAGSLFIDFYLVGLTLLWIWTRILLSEWDHWRICHVCKPDLGPKRRDELVPAA